MITKSTKRVLLVATAWAAFLSTPAHADREFADIYTDCGIGAMIAPNNDAVAAVTNVTWDLGTTAISSNISSEDACAGGKGEAAAFIYDSYPSLEKDLAVGAGEHLTALLQISGTSADEMAETVMSLRAGFAQLVTAEDYSTQTRYAKSEKLFKLLYRSIG